MFPITISCLHYYCVTSLHLDLVFYYILFLLTLTLHTVYRSSTMSSGVETQRQGGAQGQGTETQPPVDEQLQTEKKLATDMAKAVEQALERIAPFLRITTEVTLPPGFFVISLLTFVTIHFCSNINMSSRKSIRQTRPTLRILTKRHLSASSNQSSRKPVVYFRKPSARSMAWTPRARLPTTHGANTTTTMPLPKSRD